MDILSDVNQSYDTIRSNDVSSEGGGSINVKSPTSIVSISPASRKRESSLASKQTEEGEEDEEEFDGNNMMSPASRLSSISDMSYALSPTDDREEIRSPSSALGLDDIALSIAQHASPTSKNIKLDKIRNLYRFYLHMKVPRSSTSVLFDTVTRLEEMQNHCDVHFNSYESLNIHELVFFEQIQSEKYLDVSKVCYKDHSKFHDHYNLFRIEKGINEQDFPQFDCNIELFDAAQMQFVSITEDLDYLWHIENDTFAFHTNIHHHPSKDEADVYLGLKIPFWWWKDIVLLPLMKIRNELNRECALRDLILVQNPYLPISQRLHYLYYKYIPCPRLATSPHRNSKSIIEIGLYGLSTLVLYLPFSILVMVITLGYTLINAASCNTWEREREVCSLEWLAWQFGGGDGNDRNDGNGDSSRMESGASPGESSNNNPTSTATASTSSDSTSTHRTSSRSYSRVDLDMQDINENANNRNSVGMQFKDGSGNTFTTVSVKVKSIDVSALDYSTLLTPNILRKSESMVGELNKKIGIAIRTAKSAAYGDGDDNGTNINTSIVSNITEVNDDVSSIGGSTVVGKEKIKIRQPIHLNSDEALIWQSEGDSLVYREEEMEVYRLYGVDDTGKQKRLRIFDQVNSYFEIQIPK